MPPRRRERGASSESDSNSNSDSSDDGSPQDDGLIQKQRTGGYRALVNDERNYTEWVGRNAHDEQVHIPGNGAMFPEGYQPCWTQVKPWRCPVHKCHQAFDLANRLGNHFKMAHRKMLFHDCRNGKFLPVGRKRIRTAREYRHGRSPKAAIVVSRASHPGGQPRPRQEQAQQGAGQLHDAAQAPPAAPPAPAPPAPAGAAPAPASSPAPQLVRPPAPPVHGGNGAPSSSAPAALIALPIRPLAQLPLPLRELPPAAANNQRNNGNRLPSFVKPKNPSIWDYITSYTSYELPLPLDTCIVELLSKSRACALPQCWRHLLRTSTPLSPSPTPTPSPPPPPPSFYPPSRLSQAGLAIAGPSTSANSHENDEENQNPNSSGPLTLKALSSIVLYLSRRDSITPCNSPHCPVGKLSRDRFNEITKAFNDGSTIIHKDMAFPKCKGLRAEEFSGNSEIAKAVRERFGEFGGCVNAYWAHGEEVPIGDVVMDVDLYDA
ncbi:hypothetical protein B0T20DRAFT_474278 [Sordaria brevicollis]|uniref:C2H2-type domain-containing protein n=1 Tax=Sordaria brevicollis TaxID=83679 RepID=A0AAE0UFL6_SORBR|nr:hypothetical protein B0T20DRAFT_474278 [Sordaria brevicollis]